jgi:putative addiction module killer protein
VRESQPRKIETYVRANGKAPFEEWISTLRDTSAKAKICTRIDRMRFGNFGDCKSVGHGVFELRIHFGPGYRVYFGLVGSEVVLLLAGGDKASKSKDTSLAERCWKEFRNG